MLRHPISAWPVKQCGTTVRGNLLCISALPSLRAVNESNPFTVLYKSIFYFFFKGVANKRFFHLSTRPLSCTAPFMFSPLATKRPPLRPLTQTPSWPTIFSHPCSQQKNLWLALPSKSFSTSMHQRAQSRLNNSLHEHNPAARSSSTLFLLRLLSFLVPAATLTYIMTDLYVMRRKANTIACGVAIYQPVQLDEAELVITLPSLLSLSLSLSSFCQGFL